MTLSEWFEKQPQKTRKAIIDQLEYALRHQPDGATRRSEVSRLYRMVFECGHEIGYHNEKDRN